MTHHRHVLLIGLTLLVAFATGCSLVTDFSSHDGDRDGGGNNNTVPPTCGNGAVDEGEACDDGNEIDWDGCTGCQPSERQIPEISAGDQTAVAVAVSAEGEVALAWMQWSTGGTSGTLRLRLLNHDFSDASADHALEAPSLGQHATIQVGWADLGDVVVAYKADAQPISYNHVTDRGMSDSGPIVLDTTEQTNADNPTMSCVEGEGCVVAWLAASGGRWGIRGRRIDSAGAGVASSADLASDGTISYATPTVALRPDRSFGLAWRGVGVDNYLRVFDENGDPLGTLHSFGAQSAEAVESMSIASDGTGFVVLYGRELSNKETVLAQKFDGIGARVGGEFIVSDPTEGVYHAVTSSSAAACTEAGTYLGVFVSASGTGTIDVRLRAAEDVFGLNTLRLNRYEPGLISSPVLACASESARCVAAWQNRNQDGEGLGVYAVPLDVSDVPVMIFPDGE